MSDRAELLPGDSQFVRRRDRGVFDDLGPLPTEIGMPLVHRDEELIKVCGDVILASRIVTARCIAATPHDVELKRAIHALEQVLFTRGRQF